MHMATDSRGRVSLGKLGEAGKHEHYDAQVSKEGWIVLRPVEMIMQEKDPVMVEIPVDESQMSTAELAKMKARPPTEREIREMEESRRERQAGRGKRVEEIMADLKKPSKLFPEDDDD